MFDHEIKSFAARVAFCCQCKRTDFSDEEMMVIENSYHYNEAPADTALTIELARASMAGRPLIVEDEEVS